MQTQTLRTPGSTYIQSPRAQTRGVSEDCKSTPESPTPEAEQDAMNTTDRLFTLSVLYAGLLVLFVILCM